MLRHIEQSLAKFCRLLIVFLCLNSHFSYVSTNQPASLFIVPETYKKVVEFSPDEYGEYITRLLNLVQSQFPSADAFIDDFLKVKE